MLSVGHILDNTYRLIRFVGEGGMGTVYEATHARLAGRYAIKVLLEKLSENPEALARFQREGRITSLLQHPNVVEVIDYNTAADGTEYLVMEYLAGESLAQRLFGKGPVPLETAVGIIDQIATGLAAAHAHGIVHRDLKPDNVFLVPVEGRETETVKILDFGISKMKGATWGIEVPEGGLCGTPQYMAPEQVEGRAADVDAATDQFALAVIAYEMLTGRNPFQGDTVGAVFSQILNGNPPPTGIGADVDVVVRRGLAKSNRARFARVTDFSDALRAVAAERAHDGQVPGTITARAAGATANAAGRGKTRQREWGMALIATTVASLSMSFVVGQSRDHPPPPPRALSTAPAEPSQPRVTADGQHRRGRQAVLSAQRDEVPPPEVVEQPAIVPLIAAPNMPLSRPEDRRSSTADRGRRRGTFGRTAAPLPPRKRPPLSPYPLDDDATMPPDPNLADPP